MPSTVPFPPGYGVRPVRLDDAVAVAAAYDRNREHLAPWDPTRPPEFFTPEGQRVARGRQLELVDRGQLAAWVLVREHLRRGLARAAVEHACAEARGRGLHRVEAGTLLHNVASQRVLLATGFEHIGTARGYLFIARRWEDHRLYQRLLHDDPPPGQPG